VSEEDIERVREKIRAKCPIHWSWAEVMLAEILRLRGELAAVHAAIREELIEEQEVP